MAEETDSGLDESFEILDVRGTAGGPLGTVMNTVTQYLDKYPTTTRVVLGGTGGYVTGYVFKTVGKTAASAVGGGLLLIQIAHKAGYITINTSRLNRDARRFERRVRNEMRQNESAFTNFARRGEEFVRNNSPAALGFAAGFLIGLST
ncbi:FUN14 domain-containing protein 1-like [Styela clava]